jgi:putative inorganic carbon (hco3(-)) transporter
MINNEKIAGICKYLFIALLFFLPLSLEKEVLGTNTKLLFLTEPICGLLTVLMCYFYFINRKVSFNISNIDILSFIFVCSIITSALVSDDYLVSIKYSISLIWYFCGGYLVVRTFDFSPFQKRLSIISYLLGVFILVLYILNNFRKMGIFYESSYRVSAPFIQEGHTDMSVVIEPALLLVAMLFLLIPLKNEKVVKRMAIISTAFLAVIMFSCSKASYAALFISFAVFVLILWIRKPTYIVKLSYFVVPFLMLVGIWQWNDYRHKKQALEDENSYYNSGSDYYDPNNRNTYKATNMLDELFNQSTDTKKNDSNKERINRWKAGVEMFTLNPTFGIGMGTFPDKYLDFLTIDNDNIDENYLTENRMNLHNIFLGWLVEGGIITFFSGLGLILVFFSWFLKDFRKGKYSFLKILILMYMISFIFHGFVHDFSQNARIIIPFWVCLAIVSRQMVFAKPKIQQELIQTN